MLKRKTVADTDSGREVAAVIKDLEALLAAYREGVLVEKINLTE